MTRYSYLDRPALAALAAAMALSATPVVAQVAAPTLPETPVASTPPAGQTPAPTVVAPVLPGQAATLPPMTVTPPPPAPAAPTVAPRIEAPRLPEAAPAPVEAAGPAPRRAAEARPARETPRAQAPAQPAERAEAAPPAPVEARTEAPAAAPVMEQPLAEPAPLTVAEVPPAPAEAAMSDDRALWVLGTGGAILVLGAGAFLALRRRDRREEARDIALTQDAAMAPAPVAAASPASVAFEPPAPATSVTLTPRHASDQANQLEAMAAAPPSAENPFLSRRNRIRRAAFILEHGHVPAPLAVEPEPVAASKPAPVAAPVRPVREAAMARKASGAPRAASWKPITT